MQIPEQFPKPACRKKGDNNKEFQSRKCGNVCTLWGAKVTLRMAFSVEVGWCSSDRNESRAEPVSLDDID